jgi:hypothetical protein
VRFPAGIVSTFPIPYLYIDHTNWTKLFIENCQTMAKVNLDSATTGALAEHDMILSISEEAINRQFQLLYNKPIVTGPGLPPPPGLKRPSGAPTAAPKHYISHDLTIQKQYREEDESMGWDADLGIFAHVKCPRISFSEPEQNMARVTFEFEQVPGTAKPDSEYRYEVGSSRRRAIKSKPINGWSMSWRVKIAERQFKNVFEGKFTKVRLLMH